MNTKALWIIIAVLLVLLIGFVVFGMDREPATEVTVSTESATTSEPTVPPATSPSPVTITYDGTSFSPASVTVPVGTTVTWVNTTSERMWVASDDHPTHTRYDGTSTSEHCANGTATSPSVFDQCGAGARYSFTFTKTGSWEYHNHANSRAGGTVVVE